MSRQWTKPQNDAITARGGPVLVSAAAGSGKTAVLVERAISLICDKKSPVDADRLLIVTFSNAAAAEMKQRMSVRLGQMIRENPRDLFLQRQQALLAAAQISTIHSFCLELLRLNFQNLDISPDFGIADENELSVMKNEQATACVEKAYEDDENGEFASLVELLITGRDDRGIVDTIIKIYDFSRSHPFFEDWLDEKLTLYDSASDVSTTIWGNSLLRYAKESLEFCMKSARSAADIVSRDEKMEKAYGNAFRSDIEQFEKCLAAAALGDWDGLVKALSGYAPEKLGRLFGEDALKQRVKDIRAQNKNIIKELSEKYINAAEDEFKQDIADIKPKITFLFSLVKDFAKRFAQAKSDKRRLDFSDFEHLALRLLVEKTPDGYVRTARAKEISERFEYVMVDEYQDTNEVQDLIFTSVSRGQENLFMVGDVKQSIYAFRQAMPEIFIAKRQSSFPYETGFFPAKINLDTNFRSRSTVTLAVNFLFSLLMSENVGGIDYNEDESLKCGAGYPEYADASPVLLLTAMEDYAGEKDTVALEAASIASEIARMIEDGYTVFDGGEARPVEPRDFCVLLRAPKNRADIYVRELGGAGIAAWAESSGGYLAAREVSSVMCMLKAVDNPLLDIELIAAMLSPFFDFTDDDIAKIRLEAHNVPFYTALALAAEKDAKARGFLKIFHELRVKSAIFPADKLIMLFYDMTSAVSIVRAMPMGESRAANLRLLIQYASEYHILGYKQLGGFIGFISRLEEKKRDLAPANTMSDGANVVRVMSIHRSKGLEFPIVFLADTAKSFNRMDLRSQAMLHSKYGFACVRRDRHALKQFPTLPMQSIRLEAARGMISEEMRILYVALTRAKEKLIISAMIKSDIRKKLAGLRYDIEKNKLAPYATGKANSYADWILSALLHHESASALRELAGADGIRTFDDGNDWDIIINMPESDVTEPQRAQIDRKAPPDEEMLKELHRRAKFAYPFMEYTKIPAKLAVSDVAKGERSLSYRFSSRPKFMSLQALTPAEKGNAMHKFMQFASYENARDNLENEIKFMQAQEFLSPIEAASLDKKRLAAFFKSSLADRIFNSEKVLRELKFMSERGGDMLGKMYQSLPKDAKIVLQGVADCVFIEKDGAVIVDYKTDYVSEPVELAKRYKHQLELYRLILSESLDMPVKQCILYSFCLSSGIEI